MAILTGFSIPVYFPQSWDHTYALSDDGFVWPCFGRSTGGNKICSDVGDSSMADCLAQPNSHAGIIYLVTGVCHQAASRILWPAKLLVDQAGGYGWSYALFGPYGTDPYPWPELEQCGKLYGVGATSQQGSGAVGANKQTGGLFQKVWDACKGLLSSWSSLAGAEEQTLAMVRAELEALASEKLGENYDRDKVDTVVRMQTSYRLKQRSLASDLSTGHISREQYLNAFSALLAESAAKSEAVLGHDDFVKLFGVTPQSASRLSESECESFLSNRELSQH